jgi:hypothetical protein
VVEGEAEGQPEGVSEAVSNELTEPDGESEGDRVRDGDADGHRVLLEEPEPASGEPEPLRDTEVDTEGQPDADGDAVLLKEVTGVRVPTAGDGVATTDADSDTVLLWEKEPITEDDGERVSTADTLAQLLLFPEREGVADTLAQQLLLPEREGDADTEAQREALGERLDVGQDEGANEVVALTVELLLGLMEKLTFEEALPEREMIGVAVPFRDSELRVEAVPEREGDADTEGLMDTLMERLLVTEEEHVGLTCSERKLHDSGQLQAVGAKEPSGQKEPRGQAMGLPTLVGQ